MTPAYFPVSCIWRREHGDSFWEDDGYLYLMVCRGARFHVKELVCDVPCKTWRGWMKARGALWIMSEGVYHIREEQRDVEQFAAAKEIFAEPQDMFAGRNTHFWHPSRQADTDDS
jgi:hypothetical protein